MSPPTVADALVAGLRAAGVARVFGVPGGGSSLDLMAAAARQDLPFVLTHGETAAALMAAVAGQLEGAPGAVLVSLGPGLASAVNGIAAARLDRLPLLVCSDRHPAGALAFTSHQVLDHARLLEPVVKASITLTPETVSSAVADAARLAMTEPRGPVHLDLPADVAGLPAREAAESSDPSGGVPLAPEQHVARGSPPPTAAELMTREAAPYPDARALDAAGTMLAGASRPLLICGLYCRTEETARWVRALAEALPAPVLVTYQGKGTVPGPHPLALGLFTGGTLEADLVADADLLVTVGFDAIEMIPRPWRYPQRVLHLGPVTHDARCYRPAGEVVGALPAILEELAARLRGPRGPRADGGTQADWDVAALDRRKRDLAARLAVAVPGLAPHRVVAIAREATPPGTVATVDAGAHMFPATTFWHALAPGECLISNGLATMGFALPAAIGAGLARPGRRVMCLTGDGGLLLAVAELETLARLALPVTVVVFDDRELSLIRVKQEERGLARLALGYDGPDFTALGASFGLPSWVAATEREVGQALEAALALPGPSLVAARVDASAYPGVLAAVRGSARSPS